MSQEAIAQLLASIRLDIIATDKKFEYMFNILCGICLYKKIITVGPRKRVVFKCTHKNLADADFGWECGMGICPYLAGAVGHETKPEDMTGY